MKKSFFLIFSVFLLCFMLVGCNSNMNSGEEDILYNDIVYSRTVIPNYNMALLESNKTYIGDFLETYDYGNQLPWEVFTLNSEENVLFSNHAVWIKPGYTFPDEYGEEFTKAEYVISEGILDEYKETVIPLITFEENVTLEDIIESVPITPAEYITYADVRFHYKKHPDMAVFFQLCAYEDEYYLNVREDTSGGSVLFKLKPKYEEALVSAIVRD